MNKVLQSLFRYRKSLWTRIVIIVQRMESDIELYDQNVKNNCIVGGVYKILLF